MSAMADELTVRKTDKTENQSKLTKKSPNLEEKLIGEKFVIPWTNIHPGWDWERVSLILFVNRPSGTVTLESLAS